MEIRCKGKYKRMDGTKKRCTKNFFFNINAKGRIKIKCSSCKTIQIINLEG